MSLKQPVGRIVVNTGVGNCDKVNPADVDEFSFLGDDRVHRYTVNDEIVEINKFKKALEELGKTRF